MRTKRLIERLEYIKDITLYGGNDPEDPGSAKEAVEQTIEALIEYFQPAANEEQNLQALENDPDFYHHGDND